jgi:Ca-activated chloride channel family protein
MVTFVAEDGNDTVIDDGNIQWTVVSPDTEESFASGVPGARLERELDAGRYIVRAELGTLSGIREFSYDAGGDLLVTVTLLPSATLDAPPTAAAGSEISIGWTGPDAPNDFITIVPPDTPQDTNGPRIFVRSESPVSVRMPDDPGAYELRYVMSSTRSVLASVPIQVTAVTASLEAPPTAGAGSEVAVGWVGPDNTNDYVTVVPAGTPDGDFGTRYFTRNGSPLGVRMPDEPGAYELRYQMGQSHRVISRQLLTVN